MRGTYWIACYLNGFNVTYFDSFGVEDILKGIKKFMGNKNMTANSYVKQTNYSIMWV